MTLTLPLRAGGASTTHLPMRIVQLAAFFVAFSIGSAAVAEQARCPKWEAGARYPWMSNTPLRHDRFAWVHLDVDRKGYPIRCRIGHNNLEDAEARVWFCKQYYDRWRGARASASEPAVRKLKRYALIAGPKHAAADRRARKLWFEQHPEERPKCYPEPSRPDRMDL